MVSADIWIHHCVLLIILFITCEAQVNSVESPKPTLVRLSEHLMKDYKMWMRPVKDWRKSTTVYIDVRICSIMTVDEKQQLIKSHILYNQVWKDEFLTWDPMEFENVSEISIFIDKIWVPDMMIYEFVETEKAPAVPYVYVNSSGFIYNNKPMLIVTSCHLTIYTFPFDVQNCSLTFISRVHSVDDINVALRRSVKEVNEDRTLFINNGEWELLHVIPTVTLHEDDKYRSGAIVIHVVIKRRPLFYVVNLLLPSMFLMFMDIIGFYLPPHSGERVSFKITLLLGYSVFLIVVSDTLPVTAMGTPLIEVYFIVCMALLGVSLSETILIVRIVNMKDIQPQVPMWVNVLVLKKMASLLSTRYKERLGLNTPKQMERNHSDNMTDCNTEHGKGCLKSVEGSLPLNEVGACMLQEITLVRQYLEKSQDNDTVNQWLQVGFVLDFLLFRVYMLVVIAYTVTMASMWQYWHNP